MAVSKHTSTRQELAGLTGYKYTPETVYSHDWDHESLISRGIAYDENGKIVARPFEKFFNYDELFTQDGEKTDLYHILEKESSPRLVPNMSGRFRVMDKLDGSLGIAFWWKGHWYVKTGGSFDSEQALWATEFLNNSHIKHYNMEPGYTYCFEIIWHEDIHPLSSQYTKDDLVLLGVISNESGNEIGIDAVRSHARLIDCEVAEQYEFENITDVIKYAKALPKTKEGVVVTWESGFKCKIKGDEFLSLQRLFHNLDAEFIYDHIGEDLKVEHDVKMMIPEEMPDLKKKAEDMERTIRYYYANCFDKAKKIKKDGMTRKDAYAMLAAHDAWRFFAGVVLNIAFSEEPKVWKSFKTAMKKYWQYDGTL